MTGVIPGGHYQVSMRPCALVLLLVGLPCQGCTSRESRANATPPVSRVEAEQIAVARVAGGKILDGDLQTARAGLVWSFDVARAGTRDRTEVEIDAISGKVVSTRRIAGPDEDLEEPRPRR